MITGGSQHGEQHFSSLFLSLMFLSFLQHHSLSVHVNNLYTKKTMTKTPLEFCMLYSIHQLQVETIGSSLKYPKSKSNMPSLTKVRDFIIMQIPGEKRTDCYVDIVLIPMILKLLSHI